MFVDHLYTSTEFQVSLKKFLESKLFSKILGCNLIHFALSIGEEFSSSSQLVAYRLVDIIAF